MIISSLLNIVLRIERYDMILIFAITKQQILLLNLQLKLRSMAQQEM